MDAGEHGDGECSPWLTCERAEAILGYDALSATPQMDVSSCGKQKCRSLCTTRFVPLRTLLFGFSLQGFFHQPCGLSASAIEVDRNPLIGLSLGQLGSPF
jgi:hypothetical protein